MFRLLLENTGSASTLDIMDHGGKDFGKNLIILCKFENW